MKQSDEETDEEDSGDLPSPDVTRLNQREPGGDERGEHQEVTIAAVLSEKQLPCRLCRE